MILSLVGIFVSILMITTGLIVVLYRKAYSPERTIIKRVESFYQDRPDGLGETVPLILRDDQLSEIPFLNQLLEKLNFSKNLRRRLEQAGSSMKVGDLILVMCIFGGFGLLVSLITPSIFLKLVFCLLFGSIPLLRVNTQRKNRLKAFIREFPDALDMMTSAIRAGHALNQAIQLVGQEAPDPVGIEFKRTFERHNLGLNLRESLLDLTGRIDSLDLKLFVTAVLLQRETGGNLTDILEKISYTIRERFKLIGKIKTYTAQGRMTAWIVGTLPIIFVLIISVLNPGYLTPLSDDKIGHYLILIAVILQIIGIFIIRKIVRIKYQ